MNLPPHLLVRATASLPSCFPRLHPLRLTRGEPALHRPRPGALPPADAGWLAAPTFHLCCLSG